MNPGITVNTNPSLRWMKILRCGTATNKMLESKLQARKSYKETNKSQGICLEKRGLQGTSVVATLSAHHASNKYPTATVSQGGHRAGQWEVGDGGAKRLPNDPLTPACSPHVGDLRFKKSITPRRHEVTDTGV